MTTFGSDNLFPLVRVAHDISAVDPPAGQTQLRADSSGRLFQITPAGTITYLDAAGLTDPMTTRGDLIVRNASNVTARLGRGSAAQVLTSDGTDIAWAAPSGGLTDPMTTRGDVIIRNASNVTARLGRGSAGYVLTSDGTDVAWAAASGSSGPPSSYRPPAQAVSTSTAGSSLAQTVAAAVSNSSVFIAQTASVASAKNVSSITQTNVTWTAVSSKVDGGTSAKVELWKGVPTGTPGTTVTVTWSASSNNCAAITEWPASYGLAWTHGTNYNGTATSTQPYVSTGFNVNIPVGLSFVTMAVASGAVGIGMVAPARVGLYPLVEVQGESFMALGYCWAVTAAPLSVYVPISASAAWATMIDPYT